MPIISWKHNCIKLTTLEECVEEILTDYLLKSEETIKSMKRTELEADLRYMQVIGSRCQDPTMEEITKKSNLVKASNLETSHQSTGGRLFAEMRFLIREFDWTWQKLPWSRW